MSERPRSDRSGGASMGRRVYDALARTGRFGLIVVVVLLVVGSGITGRMYGRRLASSDTAERDAAILQLRAETQKLDALVTEQNGKLATLQTKFKTAQAMLDAIMPSKNTYSILPNQSMIVGDGHLTIGLICSPTNEGININVNGKPESVAAGDVIQVTPDQATSCQVAVQSFDMFKAVLIASCAAAKPQ